MFVQYFDNDGNFVTNFGRDEVMNLCRSYAQEGKRLTMKAGKVRLDFGYITVNPVWGSMVRKELADTVKGYHNLADSYA